MQPQSLIQPLVNMKKFYTLVCAGFFLTLSTSAQIPGFSAAYRTAVPGNFADQTIWIAAAPYNGFPPSVANGGPSAYCNNCLIDLELPTPGTIVMNTGISLSGGSELLIGPGVTLQIPPSGAANPANGNGINLTDQNTGQVNRIVWADNTAKLDATLLTAAPGTTAQYDGVFTSQLNDAATSDMTLTKQIGVSPSGFHVANGALLSTTPGTPQFGDGSSIVGPITLSNSNGAISLPIIISSFTATLDQNVVNLAWTTSSESNADHFAIQRSVDAGAHWTTLGTEVARGGSTTTNYTYADNSPANGASEYRLQLVDKDGTYKYSEVRTVRNSLISAVSVFPNPARDYVNIALGGKSTENILIRLYNQNGQLVQLKNVANAGGTTVPLSVHGYAEGTYFIVVNGSDGASQTSKFLIAK
jgi:hypothetical protein